MNTEADTPETEVPASGLTEEQAVNQLLEKWNKADDAKKPAKAAKSEKTTPKESPAPQDETTEVESKESEAEAQQSQDDAGDEGEESEDGTTDGEIEIDVAGEKFSVPKAFEETAKRIQAKAKEVEAGATKKFQAAADAQKAVNIQLQVATQLQKFAEANADLIGDNNMVARRLRQLENIDIQNTDSDTLSRLNAEYNQLTAAQKRIADQYQANVTAQRQEEAKAIATQRSMAEKQLAAELKGWGPEHAKRLAEYAITQGAPAEALQGINQAWMVKILDDAAYGRQMRDSKPEVTKRVAETPKTLRPGAAGPSKPANSAKATEALARSKKSGTVEDAALAWLARTAARKR